MASDPDNPAEELAEQEQKKEDEVLKREGLEQVLMQQDVSGAGEAIEGVDDSEAEAADGARGAGE